MELQLNGAYHKDKTNSIHSSQVFLLHFVMLWLT